jgi:DNA-binding FrmR family transcriptional regulator
MSHIEKNKGALVARVRRIAGQVAALERALEEDASCSVVLHQVAGVRGAINGLMDEVIEEHMHEHVVHPDLDAAARASGASELLAAIRRYAK